MSYYTGVGDYYSGKGDPGLFGFLGSAVKGVARALIPGAGVAMDVVEGITRTVRGSKPTPAPQWQPAAMPSVQLPPAINVPPPPAGISPRASVTPAPAGGCGCPTGFHMEKQGRGYCVKNRKTNYTNPRALSRAAKRLDGFVTVARKALKSTKYKVVSDSYKQNWRKPLKK